MSTAYSVVVPTIGRASLAALLERLASAEGPPPQLVVVVDDRPPSSAATPLPGVPGPLGDRVCVVPGGGRGPAAARNAGWMACRTRWVAFLDDDVVPSGTWKADLVADLARAAAAPGPSCAVSKGRVEVPAPPRPPTDDEREVMALATAPWVSADAAVRRDALQSVGGFDEGFRRAYREDSDLALRLVAAGWSLTEGSRVVEHPLRQGAWWSSVARQRGNADDARMSARHGRRWRRRLGVPPGRFRLHLATVLLGATAAGAALGRRPRLAVPTAVAWAAATSQFAWARIRPGPRTLPEVAAMGATSVFIPPAALGWRVVGWWRSRPVRRNAAGKRSDGPGGRPTLDAILFDRDGTLIDDLPYNGEPALVEPRPGAREAVALARSRGLFVGVISNQSGVARGLLEEADVRAVNARVDELVGPFDLWLFCPHGEDDGCTCRKPAPGQVLEAARRLGTEPGRCGVIGDIGSDMGAASRAGARGVLVPTGVTRPAEVSEAPRTAPDLHTAVAALLAEGSPG